VVDDGAAVAIRENGKSLLASGIRDTIGHFQVKDLVQITSLSGQEIARGLVNFSSSDLRRIQGRSSEEIREILNTGKSAVVVHRNNLVLL